MNSDSYPRGTYGRAYFYAQNLVSYFGEETFFKLFNYVEGEKRIPNLKKWLEAECKDHPKYGNVISDLRKYDKKRKNSLRTNNNVES